MKEDIESKMDLLWKDVLDFYLEEIQGCNPKKRLLKIHPFIVEKKINLLFDLYPFMKRVFLLEGKKVSFNEKDHKKNIENLVKTLN